ncbi:MAG: class II aldolase/adducin family protein [Chloroflexota bacterium]
MLTATQATSTTKTNSKQSEDALRVDLAAAFRWAARLNYHEAVANHFSVAVSDDGRQFLLQPVGYHFSQVKASDMLLLDLDNPVSLEAENAPDPSAWFLHGHLHQRLPQARCILHVHTPSILTLACLKDYEFLMLDQNAARFYGRIAYDRHYNGLAIDDAEGERVASLMGDGKSVLFMGNHGVMVIGASVAEAFDELYFLERAAHVQVMALQTGRELAIIPDDIAAKAERQWNTYPTGFANQHFNALKQILDKEEADYKA